MRSSKVSKEFSHCSYIMIHEIIKEESIDMSESFKHSDVNFDDIVDNNRCIVSYIK